MYSPKMQLITMYMGFVHNYMFLISFDAEWLDATATVKRCTKWCMQWLAKCGQLGCLPWSALQKLEHSLMLPERNNVTHCDNGLTLTPNCHPGKSIVHHYHSPFLNINKWNCSAVFSRSALFSTLWRACHSSQGPFRSSVPKLRLSRLSTCKLCNIWSFSCSHFRFNLRPIYTFILIGQKNIKKEHQNATDPGPTRCWRLGCATD